MSPAYLLRHIAKHSCFILVGALVAASLFLGHAAGQPAAAEGSATLGATRAGAAAAGPTPADAVAAPNTPSAETWISCTPVGIVTYRNRVHVRCAAAVGGISFFAAGTTDAAYAARVLSTITTAQVAGRTLAILYDPSDLSGASIGCQTNDCRLILGVGFGQ